MSAANGRTLPLQGNTLDAVMGQLRDLATASYTSLLVADGPPQPDYILLDLCAEALHATKLLAALEEASDRLFRAGSQWTEAERAAHIARCESLRQCRAEVTTLGRRAARLKATTPAGIYAKALLVRMSVTGAAVLAMSLAVDLVECEGLRATLWPARQAQGVA